MYARYSKISREGAARVAAINSSRDVKSKQDARKDDIMPPLRIRAHSGFFINYYIKRRCGNNTGSGEIQEIGVGLVVSDRCGDLKMSVVLRICCRFVLGRS